MNDPAELAKRAVDELGAAFLAGDTGAVLALFAGDGDVLYAGSEPGEVALGRGALETLLDELLARDERYSWRTTTVAALEVAGRIHLVADSELSVHPLDVARAVGPASEVVGYRVTGVLEPEGRSWRWRLCQGSEPAGA